ncbi:MAG: hypothetical protein IVW56_09495 [Candidatus Binataceae bacterium]|nr:hypothetical protein [Candidatus Binataceae bacterium]
MSADPAEARVYGFTRGTMRDCLMVIEELTAANGISPSFAEIRRELDLASMSQVARLIAALEFRGHLARRPGRARTLTVLRSIPLPEEPEIELTASGWLAAQSLERSP